MLGLHPIQTGIQGSQNHPAASTSNKRLIVVVMESAYHLALPRRSQQPVLGVQIPKCHHHISSATIISDDNGDYCPCKVHREYCHDSDWCEFFSDGGSH